MVGNTKKFANFVFLKLHDAGHMVPMDQPRAALAMIEEFMATKTLRSEGLRQVINDGDEEFDSL